ncbi:CLUMA_CG011041, isoform A [Clunio marinus]|uniref:Flavin-containing monooxygenase n=1 Tax=Clunio marinus TaxID=568069 RepID=A0A1J1IBQ1_9DIPT|nr:CLUMA_CG011041, isoform A [Clunio marinus]
MKVGIIGAGAAGLCAIKHALSFDCEVIAFEQSDRIGGTWVYTDDTGSDKHGNAIHSSMYKNLRTNLPKELMAFPDFPFPPQEKSFLPASEVNEYLNLYADNFNLRQFVKFEHHVVRVRPTQNESKWEVIVKKLLDQKYETFIFDAMLVCNGHFTTPNIPQFKGSKVFQGRQIHSHDYKIPDVFVHRKVLVIGAGPSGVDISQEVAKSAERVLWSNHLKTPKEVHCNNLIQKPDIKELTVNGAEFVDGSYESFNDIIYCTGYKYTFPFMSVDCGLATDDNYVRPLFKHCLNINHTSMGIIGLPVYIAPFQAFDLQIRFCLTFITGRKMLPSKEEMCANTEKDMNERWSRGLPKKKAHAFGSMYQDKYFDDLASFARITPVKPVILKIYDQNKFNQQNDLVHYRQYKYTVIDDEQFEAILPRN